MSSNVIISPDRKPPTFWWVLHFTFSGESFSLKVEAAGSSKIFVALY
jgi:hypothetical protein